MSFYEYAMVKTASDLEVLKYLDAETKDIINKLSSGDPEQYNKILINLNDQIQPLRDSYKKNFLNITESEINDAISFILHGDLLANSKGKPVDPFRYSKLTDPFDVCSAVTDNWLKANGSTLEEAKKPRDFKEDSPYHPTVTPSPVVEKVNPPKRNWKLYAGIGGGVAGLAGLGALGSYLYHNRDNNG